MKIKHKNQWENKSGKRSRAVDISPTDRNRLWWNGGG